MAVQKKNARFIADNQARYAELIAEVKPFLARKNRPDTKNFAKNNFANTSELLDNVPASEAHRLTETYLAGLDAFDERFAGIAPRALDYCERDEFYRYWGAVHHWQYWAERGDAANEAKKNDPDEIADTAAREAQARARALREYERKALAFTGIPMNFAQIKARGETEFETVSAELSALEARLREQYGESLEEFAARPDHLSRTDADLKPRLEAALRRIEAAFEDDFAFAPVPAGSIITKAEYGPYFAVASYNRAQDAMVVYWQTGVYNHVYDTMLAVHEIMPGHHQQLAMAREPICTRGPVSTPTVFLEGWASYAEILAEAKGLFAAPDQRLGWLDYRLIRAMRIIMETALIEGALTETQARELWEQRMPARLQVHFEREWARIRHGPHHLSYILGADAIIAAKAHVKSDLRASFDEAEFHQAVLNSMHRSLEYLGPRMSAQIRERRAQKKQAKAPPSREPKK